MSEEEVEEVCLAASTKSQPRTVIYQCDYWEYKDNEDGKLVIISGGVTEDGRRVLSRIEGFTPFVYVELPKRIQWNATRGKILFRYFQSLGKKKTRGADGDDYETDNGSNVPLTYSLKQKYKLYGKKLINTMLLTFSTKEATGKFQQACLRRSFYIEGIGSFKAGEFVVHEHNIDPIMKLTANKKINLAGWVQATETIKEEDEGLEEAERNFSSVDIGIHVDWKNFNAYVRPKDAPPILIKRKYMGFDIESNSKNKNSKLPDPKIPENCCFQVSMTFGVQSGDKGSRKKYLLSLFNPLDIEGVEVIRFPGGPKDEGKLLLEFARIVREEDPEVLIGHNIMKFDWNYMLARAEYCGVYLKFAQMTRIIGERAVPKKIQWASAAYGEQLFRYLELTGRTNVDVLLEIERNYKMDNYTLNSSAKKFLNEEKEDLSALELFMLYEYTEVLTPLVEKLTSGVVIKETRVKLKKRVQSILPIRKCGKQLLALRKEFLDAKTGERFRELVRKAMWLIGVYCVQDTNLAVDLTEKLNLWTNMEEMANVMHVPVSYLHTRGQQIKVLAQVYRDTVSNGIIIPFKSKSKDGEPVERFQGAIVQEAVPGDHDNVTTGDFNSLYPSEMIKGNICHTTFLDPNDPQDKKVPDSECNVYEWSDHCFCEHDPRGKRKKKAEDILCKDHRYRFRKVVYKPDGTKLHEGLMPKLVKNLLVERNAVKKEMAKLQAKLDMHLGKAEAKDIEYFRDKLKIEIIAKGSLTKEEESNLRGYIGVLNAKQNALKISANSAYGGLGAVNGFIPLIPGAAVVTFQGRTDITEAIRYAVEVAGPRHGVKVELVYGDSVTEDTPILCRLGEKVFYRTIDNLPATKNSTWLVFPDGKQYMSPAPGLEVWSDKGFTPIKHIMRHQTKKDIYRVLTHTGVVDVTEDHSLLRPNGEEVAPKDVTVGEQLLHHKLPSLPRINKHARDLHILAERCAYAMGLFYGDGSCGEYDCPSGRKNSWAINNTDLKLLEKAKLELESYYGYSFTIYDTMESSAVYKLCPNASGETQDLVWNWRRLFYDNRRYKVVPDVILEASDECKTSFLQGYYDADGDQEYFRFDNKGKIGSAQLLLLVESLGFSTSINIRKDKPDIYRITCTTKKQRKNPSAIKKIWNLGPTEKYVYDLETENHHFAAGIGKMVVHNTDSFMIKFPGKSLEESYVLGEQITKEASHYLKCLTFGRDEEYSIKCPSDGKLYRIDKYPRDKLQELSDELKIHIYEYDGCPLNIAFENLYGRYLLLSKKRYLAYAVNRKGEIISTQKKGVVLSRRDNCLYLRNTYAGVMTRILDKKSESEVMNWIYDSVHKLFTMQISDYDLRIYMGVKTVINYAKKIEKKQGKNVISRTFIDANKKPIEDPTGPLDPRLVYSNIPQCLLALKMLRRGDDIPPNTRLEFIYLENPEAEHQGEKAEDFTYYRQNRLIDGLKPDYFHYVEKQLTNPLSEIIGVKFPHEKIMYEKIDDAFTRLLGKLDELNRFRVIKVKAFVKSVECRGCLHTESMTNKPKDGRMCFLHKRKPKATTYTISKKLAQAEYILESARKSKAGVKNEIDPVKNAELIKVCGVLKSRDVLERLYKAYGLRKRVERKPTQTGKFRINTEVMLTTKIGKWPIRSEGKVMLITPLDESKKPEYVYEVLMSHPALGTELLCNVPRKSITSWYRRDSKVMEDILKFRMAYRDVVTHIRKINTAVLVFPEEDE